MSEEEFWVRQIKTLVTGFLIAIALFIGSCQSTNYQVRKAIEAGAHPSVAACAMDSGQICDSALLIALEPDK